MSMSHHWSDNVHTTAFTPRDYQVELAAAAKEKNIIICLGHNSSKEFIALKLLHEKAHELRRLTDKKTSLYISYDGESTYNLLFHLTDLKVLNVNKCNSQDVDWEKINDYHVLIMNPNDCLNALICSYIQFEDINLMIIENCHKRSGKEELQDIFNYYSESSLKPQVLALAGPLHSPGCEPAHLSAELEYLEKFLQCKSESASDIVTVLRYCSKPIELVVQYAPPIEHGLTKLLRELVLTRKTFLKQHRFDPTEIYRDQFQDEIKGIPDPKIEPLEFLDEYLQVLDELGPWCADRAAANLISRIEKHKVKTPYERHFLLLGMISTTFIQIRGYCESVFLKFETEKEKIESNSSPKVLKLLEIMRCFKPDSKVVNLTQQKAVDDLNQLDFARTEKVIEDLQEMVQNLRVPEADEIKNGLADLINGTIQPNPKLPATPQKSRTKFRPNCRPPMTQRQRQYWHNQNDPDALCGLLFCNSKLLAKILFNLLCEMSRHDPSLEYLCVQFTVDRTADPITETKEAEMEHRKQEEVLKRFRMHECNFLIGTSVLEEGIDLPKSNLVIRWDPPSTYRSYVQCKGRARASNAYHIIMVGPTFTRDDDELMETISLASHCQVCPPSENLLEVFKRTTELDDVDGEENGKDSVDTVSSGSIADTESNDSPPTNASIFSEISNLYNKYRCVEGHIGVDAFNEDENYKNKFHNMRERTHEIIGKLAQYMEIEKMLIKNCENREPSDDDFEVADHFNSCIQSYRPVQDDSNSASVNLSTAIALVNKYCAKLPSDTFTKLTPLWRCGKTNRKAVDMFQYTIRLPINSPIKQDILGLPMPSRVLARRIAALITCRILHKSGELDDNLQPIGKEGFLASEPDWENFELAKTDEDILQENSEPRPGTTKRRQYYYKRIASVFSDCRPKVGEQAFLYHIKMTLQCPIPEEQNTRGRRIYPPEESLQGFGLLTLREIPKISSFPIFTRSGEVKVSLELAKTNVVLTHEQLSRINIFINYTFTHVLRLQKYLMLFDAEAVDNSFFIVPTISQNNDINVDWQFLNLIANNFNKMPEAIGDEIRKSQEFDANKFRDAVVMPWYRNQDQPQYFYVAEICYHLSPQSSFPGECYKTFQEYYFRKYNITIQNAKQPLLDVDHTSARLNFLTPRYVNRKGVALPTSSEETKRAKRENLEQKQILVPELCTIHPFPASLWRTAVCLPCILYRINALLLADEIRRQVSVDLGLGMKMLMDDSFEWPMLDFGWSLAEVLKKSYEAKIAAQNAKLSVDKPAEEPASVVNGDTVEEAVNKTANDLLEEADEKLKSENVLEIGTWSNEMAANINRDEFMNRDDWTGNFPPNIDLCSSSKTNIRYGSPTSWSPGATSIIENYYHSDSECLSDDDFDVLSEKSDEGDLKIDFKSENLAEAIESEEDIQKRQRQLEIINIYNANEKSYQNSKNIGSGFDLFVDDAEFVENVNSYEKRYYESIDSFQQKIRTSGMLVKFNQTLEIDNKRAKLKKANDTSDFNKLIALVPFVDEGFLRDYWKVKGKCEGDAMTLDELYDLHRIYFENNGSEEYEIEGTGDIFDRFNDFNCFRVDGHRKFLSLDYNEYFKCKALQRKRNTLGTATPPPSPLHVASNTEFSFDRQPNLNGHPGPSPSIILQALTMSNANDGINLERLETIGDSFLKYAITTYLYCTYENVHEGKLSHLRSKQVSNLNLYRLGRRKMFGESMIATKFEPHDNWLPPCYYVPKELEKALIEAKIPACHWNLADLPNIKELNSDEICKLVKQKAEALGLLDDTSDTEVDEAPAQPTQANVFDNFPCFIPYNLVTQHSIPDKSVADCVEALIGAYLIECGLRGALLFMAWLGIRVLPSYEIIYEPSSERICGSTEPYERDGVKYQTCYGHWTAPKSPLLLHSPNPHETLEELLDGYCVFEDIIGYQFQDRSYLLQAMTHASYTPNRLTDCYQRLEFLGDAVLGKLFRDKRPGGVDSQWRITNQNL
ncbi:Endoribonuclease Dcr-1 [Pseudolycoriella hygida]|uniref:Endoribonuclease Dcr-1 n=1 Tax=Pseudolycoriella hygida TaxID=35572 RepID=A0A9Q0N062_9DIPT|nr:Endoribonuclease Dcr-1 [Pseudolycoriella hygida]